jgi:threonine/homoserine/homoserine lactone efflux protein
VSSGHLDLAAFVGVSALVIATPGQDTALTIRNTLGGGRRGGVFTALGVVTGQLTWTLATSAGLAGLLLASELAFRVVKLVGAAYLVYLGSHSLLSAWRERRGRWPVEADPLRRRLTTATTYRQGLVSNLSNAKVALFFTSLLPQFVPTEEGSSWRLVPLGILFAAMTLIWLTVYAVAVDKGSTILREPRVHQTMEALTGIALIVLGAWVAVEAR